MKKIICLLLSLLLAMTVLTSCDYLASILDNFDFETIIPQTTTTVTEVTTAEVTTPEVTTPEVTTPEVTTPEVTTPEVTTPEVTTPEVTTPEVTTPEVTTPEVTTPEETPVEPQINYGSFINPVTTTYAYSVCANLEIGEFSAQPFYVKGTVTAIGIIGKYYTNVYFTDGETEMLIYTINMPTGIDGFEVGDAITAYGYIKNYNGIIEMATFSGSEYVYVVRVEEGNPNQGDVTTSEPEETTTEPETTTPEPEINYGSPNAPVTVTYAYNACASLENGEFSAEAFYIEGLVTEIGQMGSYYRDVYFTDGTTEMLIYTIDIPYYTDFFDVGDTIVVCGYIKNYNGIIEMATYNGSVYVYVVTVESENNNPGGDQGGTDSSNHLYTDFTPAEKTLFNSTVGLVIPFIPNSEYYVEEYEGWGETGISFYTYGNTQAEFNAYRALFSSYSYDGSETDDYGDMWYFYSKGDVYVDMSFYYYEGNYVVDVYIYITDDDWGDDDWGDDDWGDTEVDLITNDGKGLPEDDDGVYDVDFTKGEYVQNVTDQTYYLDGCPTTGTPAVLVIPIEFKDITAQSKGYSIENIKKIFNGTDLPYYSVYDYFLTSSYNQLSLDITVVDTWFRPKNSSSYYENATQTYYGEEEAIGDQLILDEALAYLATIMDLSEFDSDNNGIIDAVVMVNTLEIANDDFHWAYRYWNMYTDDEDYYYEYDGVSANDYVWVAYQFMFESTDQYGETNYNTSNPLNPYTFIHEFSHILGSDDYYDTQYENHPLNGFDMMDDMMGDHNPYTKFNLGWITSSKLIVTNGTVTVNLDAFAKNGDTIILANNWDETLGAYQEYYVITYYTMTGLNSGDGGYFARDGIVVYHVNSSLYAEQYGNETYYMVYNTNTSSGDYGTKDNLIEFVKSGNDTYTYTVGDTLPSTTDDFGNELGYTFVIDSLDAESATITFTKK